MEEKSIGGIMEKRLQVEKYMILFAIGGMAYFFGSAGPGIFTLYDVSVRRSVFYMLRSVK